MTNIYEYASSFRRAIDEAKEEGEFIGDFIFCKFPTGCCGDTCYLLAEYIQRQGINIVYICGNYYEDKQSHAWLLTEDNLIIDITGDQFKHNPLYLGYDERVYVGECDNFHSLFEVNDYNVHPCNGLAGAGDICYPRLLRLYEKIEKYL
jgi:hypothetical protein